MSYSFRDFIQGVRDTLAEETHYPDGTLREITSLSFTDVKIMRYAMRVIGNKQRTDPASMYSNSTFDPGGHAAAFAAAPNSGDLWTDLLASDFPLPAQYFDEMVRRAVELAQTEGTELASGQQVRELKESVNRTAAEGG